MQLQENTLFIAVFLEKDGTPIPVQTVSKFAMSKRLKNLLAAKVNDVKYNLNERNVRA